MNQAIYAVYGASGFGREVMPLVRTQVLRHGGSAEQIVFIDDAPEASFVNGHRVVTFDEFMSVDASDRYVSLAIANSSIRAMLAARCASNKIKLWSVVADNVVVMDHVHMDDGGVLCPFVTVTSNVRIGKSFHANIYSYVAHDCVVGDFVTFAPGVKCNGNVVVEDHAYIGTGAVIKQGRPGRPLIIGEGAIVGMGAVVTKNVPPGVTVIGNPATILSKESLRK